MLKNLDKAPFPWFGGKSQAAPLVWQLLGDVEHYVEPFAGSCAVLLNRPHTCNRPYHSETVNDADGFLVNFWRAVQWYPDETARAASWPVTEADKQARQIALLRWKSAGGLDRLAGDAAWCDPVMAGWWAYGVCCQIGAFEQDSAWTADPQTGIIYKQPLGPREPGVRRKLPSLSDGGHGVNVPQAREPGVLDAITPEHGGSALDDWGASYHDHTMPEIIRWFRHLSARLRHVRIVNGDWTRVVTHGATVILAVRKPGCHCGLFLDPPYGAEATRADGLYAADSLSIAGAVRRWCLEHGADAKLRIVLAGYDGEHGELEAAGWSVHEWYAGGWLRGGMGNVAGNGHSQAHRERLWASPGCLPVDGRQNEAVQAQSRLEI